MSLKRDLYLSRKPLAGFFAIGAAWATYFAQMPVIKANVGASDGAYGIALLVASTGAILAMWLVPVFQRVFGGMALTLGISIVALGMFASGLSNTLTLLVLGMALAAMGSGVVDVLVNARVSEIEEHSGRTLMNLNHALYSFAYAGAALVTGALREAQVDTITIFVLLTGTLLTLAFAARDRAPQLDTQGVEVLAGEMPHGFVLFAGLVVMAAFLAEAASEGWSALHIERTLGGAPGEGALGPAMMGLTMGIGRLSGHWLARRLRDTTLMLMAMLMSSVGLLLAGVAGSVAVALAGFAVAGLGRTHRAARSTAGSDQPDVGSGLWRVLFRAAADGAGVSSLRPAQRLCGGRCFALHHGAALDPDAATAVGTSTPATVLISPAIRRQTPWESAGYAAQDRSRMSPRTTPLWCPAPCGSPPALQ